MTKCTVIQRCTDQFEARSHSFSGWFRIPTPYLRCIPTQSDTPPLGTHRSVLPTAY